MRQVPRLAAGQQWGLSPACALERRSALVMGQELNGGFPVD